jgi:hypothetical protein
MKKWRHNQFLLFQKQPRLSIMFIVGEGMCMKNSMGTQCLLIMLEVGETGHTTHIATLTIVDGRTTVISYGVVRRRMLKHPSQIH